MKKTFIFSFLLLNILTFSQINRFYYELNYKPNKDSSKIEKLLTVLDIKDGKSLYLNQELAVHDSIITASNENPSKFELFDWKTFSNNTPKNSVKIIKENGIVTQNEVIGEVQNFNYVEKINFNWILSNESQKIENYNTQKATTDFGGRKWNAWFTTEIPINDGPYKFFGLPGLIVKIEDSEKEYSWTLKGNYFCKENCSFQQESHNEKYIKTIKVSKENFLKLKTNYKKDPLQGADVANPEINPTFIKEYKERLLKKINYYNNPIERD